MSDLFIEVDEALKQERIEKLWKEYGGLLISFLAMIVLITAVNAGYNSWTTHRNIKQTELYLEVSKKDQLSADDLLAIRPQMTIGMQAVVSMHAAELALKNKDTDKALDIYKDIEKNPDHEKNNPLLSYLAKYMIASLDKNIGIEEKIKLFETMGEDENNPWSYNALLDVAILQATQNNDFAKAREYLAKIFAADSKAPQGLKQKAQSLEILYQAQQSNKP